MKNLKRVLCVILAFAMICPLAVAATETTGTEEKTVYSASAEFSNSQDGVWSYSSLRDATGAIEEYTFYDGNYDGGKQAWLQGSAANVQRGYVTASAMMPGTNHNPSFSAVRVFTAPKAGLISISADNVSAVNKTYADGKYFGVDASIKKGDSVIWSHELDTREAVASVDDLKISVAEGEKIYFIATRDIDIAANNITTQGALSDNAITFDPTITYLDGSEADGSGVHIAAVEFSNTPGKNNWSYYGRKPDGVTLFTTSDYAYDSATYNAWISSGGGNGRGRIGADYMLPGVLKESPVNVIREYKVPEDGKLTIGKVGEIGAQDTASTAKFGVKIRILKNDTKIYPISGDWETLSTRDAVSAFDGLSVSVVEGDLIRFEAARTIGLNNDLEPTAMVNNILTWNPTVEITEEVVNIEEVYSDTFETAEINKAFWNTELDGDGRSKYSIVDGALTSSSGWARFYAPYAVNYSMSFDVKFTEFAANPPGGAGFYVRLRRPNGTGDFYQIKFDTTKTTSCDIVYGRADGAGNFQDAKRVSATGAWATNTLYHVEVSVETDGAKDVLNVKITNGDTTVVEGSREITSNLCTAGGGGFSVVGATAQIDNFVLKGDTSPAAIDTTLKFYADEECTTELTLDTVPDGLVVAGIEKTAGFEDYSISTPAAVFLAAYDASGMLVEADVNICDITSRHKNITAKLSGGNITSAYDYRAFVFKDITSLVPLDKDIELKYNTISGKQKIETSNDALTYFGRWDTLSDNTKLANWNAPYVRFNFTGTSLLADFEGNITAHVTIDGVTKQYYNEGISCLATGLENKTHEAMIQFRAINGKTGFKSLYIDEDAEITAYDRTTRKHVQFIGDSITTDGRSYSYTIPKEYDLDYSIISMSGIALQDGAGWYYGASYMGSGIPASEQKGMESAYFMTKSPKDAYTITNGKPIYNNTEAAWQNDAPDVIVIGIGTNDNEYINNNDEGLTQDDFKQSYIDFVTTLAEEFTDTDIYILRQFNHSFGDYTKLRQATADAYAAFSANSRIKYIDTTDWNVEIGSDQIHPTAGGYADLRDLVYNAISGSLN